MSQSGVVESNRFPFWLFDVHWPHSDCCWTDPTCWIDVLFLSLVSFVPVLRISSWIRIRGCLKIERHRVLQVPKVPWFITSFRIFQTPILAPQSAGRTNARHLARCGQGKFFLGWRTELGEWNGLGRVSITPGVAMERQRVYITQELPVINGHKLFIPQSSLVASDFDI